MNIPKTISCRVNYGNRPILYSSLAVFIAIYLSVIVVYALKYSYPMAHPFFGAWVCFGILIPIIFPILLATVISTLFLSPEGVIERKGYILGIIKKKVSMSWSEIESWDSSFRYLPTLRKSIPQINFYFKRGDIVRVTQMSKNLYCDDKLVKWDAFSKHLKELLHSVNVPNATPKVEQVKQETERKLLAVASTILILLIIVAGVLIVIDKNLIVPIIVTAAGFAAIVISIFRRPFNRKKKEDNNIGDPELNNLIKSIKKKN